MATVVGFFISGVSLLLICLEVNAACNDGNTTYLRDFAIRSPDVSGGEIYLSDHDLSAGWFRIESSRLYTMTDANSKPTIGQCSTYWPIYLKGAHPNVLKLTKDPVTAKACIAYGSYECDISYDILIRKCGPVHSDLGLEYYLRPSIRFSAYCFSETGTLCATAPPDVDFGKVFVSPELHHEDVTTDGKLYHKPYFIMRCHFNANSTLKYAVNWYIDGQFLKSYEPEDHDKLDRLTLHETMIDRLGVEVNCGVRASTGKCGEQTDITYSKAFYAGIKILNSAITLEKGNRGSVEMKLTVPIGCYYNTNSDVSTTCREHVRIFDHTESGHKCTKGGLANINSRVDNQQCATDIESLQKGHKWSPDKIYKFEFATIDENYDDKTTFSLKLAFDNTIGHKKWLTFTFPDIRVNINDTSTYKQKICYSHVDPHMRTSDKYYYEHQDEGGIFILYRNDKYGIEVQERTIRCNTRATCACAIAVRAGQDVFMINRCGGVNFLGFTRCDDGGILQVVKKNDNLYEVFTPIGTKITIQLLYAHFMNIDITMAPKDKRNTLGLCGYFDGDVQNDFRHKDTQKTTSLQRYPKPFTKSWKVPEDESLLNPGYRKLTSWGEQNGFYCICSRTGNETVAICASTQYLNCIKPGSITPKKCRIMGRKKRNAVHNNVKEMERLFTLMNSEKQRRKIKREEPQSISTEEARVLCTNKIKGSLAVTNYSEVSGNEDPDAVVDQCIYDVEVGNDETWANVHVESVNNIVKSMMELEPTYVINNSEQVETFLMNTCPGNCSSNGNCTKLGNCFCNTFYHGAMCTIDERDPLVIDDIEGGGLCDLADGDECVCFTIRSDNLLNGFKCKIQTTLYFINGTKHQSMANIEEGDYEDIFTGVCCDNGDIWSENEHVFGRVYDVSISNDGGAFSNIATVDVLNSACQEIVTNTQTPFRLKNQTCFINGLCFLDGDVSYKQTTACFSCESSVEAYDWTEKPCPTTTTVSNTATSPVPTLVASTMNTSTTTSTSASTTPETSSQSTTTMTTETSSVGSTSSPETISQTTTIMTTETSSVGSTSSPETSSSSTTLMTTETSSTVSTSSPETSSQSTTTMTTETSSVGSTSSPETSSSSTTTMTTDKSSVGSTSSPETSSPSTTSMVTDKPSVESTSSPETSSPSTTSMVTDKSSVGSTSSPETSSPSTTSMVTDKPSVESTSSPETSSPSTTSMVTDKSSVGSTSSPETSIPSTTSMGTDKSSVGSTSSPETSSPSTTSIETDKFSVGSTSSPETSSPFTTSIETDKPSVESTSSPETSIPSTTSMETDKSSVGSTTSPETSSPSTTSMEADKSSVESTSSPETRSSSSTTMETDTSSFATTPSKTAAPETQTRNLGLIIGFFTGASVIVTVIAVITVIILVRFKKINSSAMKEKQSGHVATHGSDKDSSFENLLNKDYKGLPVARSGHFNVEGQTFSTSASSQNFGDLSAVSIDFKTGTD